GLEDAVTVERALAQAQIVLSICPPHAALALARQVAETGFRGLFVDCNAIAPDTARAAMKIAEAAGARFVDGGIVGPPPTASRRAQGMALDRGDGRDRLELPRRGTAGRLSPRRRGYLWQARTVQGRLEAPVAG